MKPVGMFAASLLLVVFAKCTAAQTLGVDWKFYGAANAGGDDSLCFYDTNGVSRSTDNHIRVWTKCLSETAVNNVDVQKDYDGKIVKAAGERLANHYVPPFAIVQEISSGDMINIMAWEETADIAGIEPEAQIYYELNCTEKMIRTLSIAIQLNGKSGSNDKAGDWEYAPPETNSAALLKILCPSQ